MSTVFYGYRISKKNLWKMLAKTKELYLQDPASVRCLTYETYVNYRTKKNSSDVEDLKSYLRLKEFFEVTIQLFDISHKEYIFRVLEDGYYFSNRVKHRLNRLGVKDFFLDTRVGEGTSPMNKTYKLVDIIHLKIQSGEYLLYPVVDDTALQEASFKRFMEKMKNETPVEG